MTAADDATRQVLDAVADGDLDEILRIVDKATQVTETDLRRALFGTAAGAFDALSQLADLADRMDIPEGGGPHG